MLCFSEGSSDEDDCGWFTACSKASSSLSSDCPQSSYCYEIDICEGLTSYRSSNVLLISKGVIAAFGLEMDDILSDKPSINFTEDFFDSYKMEDSVAEGQYSDSISGINEMEYSSMGCPEGIESGHRCPFSEGSSSSIIDWSFSMPGTNYTPSLQDHVLATGNVSLPLLDIERDKCMNANGSVTIDQKFPCPPCHGQSNLQTRLSNFSLNLASKNCAQTSVGLPTSLFHELSGYTQEFIFLPRDSYAEEPLFWPFDQNSYWSIELEWSYLGISPFGHLLTIAKPTGFHSSKSAKSELHEGNSSSFHPKNKRRRARRRQSSGPLPADWKSTSKLAQDTGVHLGLCKSLRLDSDKARTRLSRTKRAQDNHWSNFSVEGNMRPTTSLEKHLLEFEADDFRLFLAGISIEALVGLDEFDGHEGVHYSSY